jgi:thiol:disulfide interchange protein DsbD
MDPAVARRAQRSGNLGYATLKTFIHIVLASLSIILAGSVSGAPAPHVRGELIAEVTSAAPGTSFEVLFHQEIDPGWHTYWRNPGDSGAAPEIKWQVPEGVTVSAFQWPYPERIPYGPLMNFGYHDDVYLIFTVTVDESFSADEIIVAGSGRVLVCEDICIPEKVSLTLTLPVSETVVNDQQADLFATARARIPTPLDIASHYRTDESGIELVVALPYVAGSRIADLAYFPYTAELIDNTTEQSYTFDERGLTINLQPGYEFNQKLAAEEVDFSGVLVIQEDAGDRLVASYSFGSGAASAPAAHEVNDPGMSLMLAMVFALLGGMILNLMPCVFPVLSIKILSLVEGVHESGESTGLHGLVYAAGVVLSFIGIALLLIALRAGGDLIGWGFQLQSPIVVGLLVYLFLLIGLNLLGVFDIGTTFMSFGNQQLGGYTGSFATGVLATVVAAPCTAPFMGAAVGFALTQSTITAIAVFGALGAGMALPYLLLCFSPGLLAKLPKPGRWMETMRQILAFPMLASAIWLLWVLGIQTGATGMMQVLSGGLLLAFALWLVGQFPRVSIAGTALRLFAVLLTVIAVYLVLMQQAQEPAQLPRTATADNGISEQAAGVYSRQALADARAKGPVFVNFTAAWCITCKVNELNALNSGSVQAAFNASKVTYLKADWTNEDPEITRALQEYGRSGVPLYLLYKEGEERAKVLPQLLTEGIILDAISALK